MTRNDAAQKTINGQDRVWEGQQYVGSTQNEKSLPETASCQRNMMIKRLVNRS
ncbi:hypothetical protein J3D56_002266 [Erwinia persicina]|nr:hypothetical protein [Erwinia persicina]